MDLIERTRIKRDIGKRSASVYGWHSLRHTFVILALDAGVPVEKVRQIVGHGEAETTIANYYNPTKEQEAERVRQPKPSVRNSPASFWACETKVDQLRHILSTSTLDASEKNGYTFN